MTFARRLALVGAALLVAACSDEPVDVRYVGFDCPELPGLDDYVRAADSDGDNRISTYEFNSAFQEAMDEVTPDGQLDRDELTRYVCRKQREKAATVPAG